MTHPKSLRQWIVAKPLVGNSITPDLFAQRELPMPEPAAGQALVRVKIINLHSRTRLRFQTEERPNGFGITSLGDTDRANYACCEVVASRDKTFKEGDVIACQAGWQDYQLVSSDEPSVGYGPANPFVRAVNGTHAAMNYVFRPEMVEAWPTEVLMDVFGTSGLTAYFGGLDCGPIMPRDRVLVAGASGSVGSMFAQLAKARGAVVVGLAGGAERAAEVQAELGIDSCLDYRAPDFEARLRAAFPDGIDVFSGGVGGDLTQMVVGLMRQDGRLFSYGAAAMTASPPRMRCPDSCAPSSSRRSPM
jgi:NADPH-dependent curcumin reductase CurA